ncbi:MAG: NarK/NasA family nitrate transporter [Acidobacteria bacterium]|nr:NarK/NasA family nitrate transporter [Acidobacteriota bacterium]
MANSTTRALDAPVIWNPEDARQWEAGGARLARRTLWITTGALTLSFSTWFMWSALVVRLPELGFPLTVGQRFWLAALPGLMGATLRIPYSFVVQMFGSRAVITLATASLLIPSIGVGLAVQNPNTPFWTLALLAVSAGFGGGNFSAFMSSTSLFFPRSRQGTALGVQAGIGNFGVSLVQFLTPLVMTVPMFGHLGGDSLTWTKGTQTAQLWIQNAAFIWVLPVVFFTVAAAIGLRSIPVKASFSQQAVIFRRKHNWIMTSLYIMTFGTFSGMSAVFALLIREVFGKLEGAPDPLQYAFLGALIGSATRPPGGWISDKIGGARVTMACGVLLLIGSIGVTWFTAPTTVDTFGPFLALILVIFFAAGVGNGSTFRMIPVIFPRHEAGPVLGWTAAIAAYGSFVLPMLFNWSLGRFGSVNQAFYVLAAFYACNLVLCWWFYARRGAEVSC